MKAKRLGVFLLAVAMVFTMFAGCGNKQGAASSSTPTGSSTNPYKNHLTISIAYWGIGTSVDASKTDPIRDIMYKKFNITITPVNITWDDYKTKVNTWAAAGTLPDVFADDAVYESNFSKWCTQGVIKKLPDDMSAYPNVKKYLAQSDVMAYRYPLGDKNGKYYCVPRPTYDSIDWWANDNACLLRKDWMTKLGFTQNPTNMDEFITMMKAFVEKDPDGNGKNDTIGCTCYDAGWLTYFFNNYEPAVGTWTKDASGQWIPGFTTDKALQGVAALKKLYDAGGLDKDFATLKGTQGMEKFENGVAGAYVHSGYPATLGSIQTAMKKANPKFDISTSITEMLPWKAADGNYYRTISASPWSETYFNYKDSDEKMDRVLRLLDWGWGVGTEGFNYMRYGIEGKDYTKSGDTITPIKKLDASGKDISGQDEPIRGLGSFWTWAQTWQYSNPASDPAMLKIANDTLSWEMKNCKATPTNLTLGFIDYDGKDKANFAFKDELTKALLSKDAVAEWKSMIKTQMSSGYTQAIAGINAKAKELGITDYTEK